MRNIKLTIEYDGTGYHGWQSQINAAAVQDVVSAAVRKLTGEDCKLVGSGRTDVGVHAFGQVANFMTDSLIPADRFAYALNSMLPDNVVVNSSEEADLDFHARFSAKGKKYRYLIYNFKFPSALLRNRAYHVPYLLDMDAMRQAAQFLLGTHDFMAFRATGSHVKTTVRTIHQVFIDKNENMVEFEIAGDGFLYNMVRIIVGTLLEVGRGIIQPEAIPDIIESHDRKRAGKTVPAHGLYLVEVYY